MSRACENGDPGLGQYPGRFGVCHEAEACVNASLNCLKMQEPTTLPLVDNLRLLATREAAVGALWLRSRVASL